MNVSIRLNKPNKAESRATVIGRYGIRDFDAGKYYWADWMTDCIGRKVYFRKDGQAIYIYGADKGDLLGAATLTVPIPALYQQTLKLG